MTKVIAFTQRSLPENDDYLYAMNAAGDADYKYPVAQLSPMWVNAADPQYATLQAAVDAVSSAGGGVVYLPPGTYNLSSALAMASNVHLLGAGSTATVLSPTGQGFAAITVTGAITNWSIKNLTIDYSTATGGGVSSNSAAIGIKIVDSASVYASRFTLEGLTIKKCYRGIDDQSDAHSFTIRDLVVDTFYSYAVYKKADVRAQGVSIQGVYAKTGTQDGAIYIYNCEGFRLSDVRIESVTGWGLVTFTYSYGVAENISFVSCTVSNGFLISNGVGQVSLIGVVVRSCALSGSTAYGLILASGSQTTIIGCLFTSFTYSGAGTYYGLYSDTTAELTLVVGQSIPAPTGSGGTAYAMVDAGDGLFEIGDHYLRMRSQHIYVDANDDLRMGDAYLSEGGGDIIGASSSSVMRDLSAQVNGSNNVFTTPDSYVAASLRVYVNGLLKLPGSEFTTTNATVFTMTVAPIAGSVVAVEYNIA